MSSWRKEILNLLSQGKGFEVDYENGNVKISEAKGISKGSVNLKEIKGVRKGKVKPPSAKLRDLIIELSSKLIETGKKFKVTLGQGDFTLRFDLDHYVRVDSKSSSVVGFKSLDEEPINVIADILEDHGEVKILKPLK
ncbi:MAG: hypothetical protein DRJ60_06430 [Thermoprotei archaeon]|nr:MAG: hypothetical protein DRJ60_06430 [Thermoprotei archaeon]